MNTLDHIDASFIELRKKNEYGYSLLFEIEVLLREFIARSLEETYGAKWVKQGVPPDIQKKIHEGLAYERTIKWHKAIPHHPIYYVDFPDLKKLIVVGTNWKTVFDAIFVHKINTDAGLSEVEIIRNKIAHNRFLTEVDLSVLKATHSKIIESVPSTKLSEAKSAATLRIPLLVPLQQLEAAIKCASQNMNAGTIIEPETMAALDISDRWWFDENYLEHDLSPITNYIAKCDEYALIIRGIGQANVRRSWVEANSANEISSRAISTIRLLIKTADENNAK